MTIRFGIPVEADALEKASEGYSRGRSHKYIRRVRVIRNGKLAWDYYYPDDIARMRAERAEKKKKGKGKGQSKHKTIQSFEVDHPEQTTGRTALGALSTESVARALGWKTAPKITFGSEKLEDQYHRSLIGDEPLGDLHGHQISPLRALEIVGQRLPEKYRQAFSQTVDKIEFTLAADDDELKKHSNWAAYHLGRGAGGKVVIGLDRSFRNYSRGHHMNGGLFGAQIIAHELGHGIANLLKEPLSRTLLDKEVADSLPNWEDYLKLYDSTLRKEPGVTQYAEKNPDERFCESFACALFYPRELAWTAPEMYEFMRDLLRDTQGVDYLPPLETDLERKEQLEKELLKARGYRPVPGKPGKMKKTGKPDPARISEVQDLLDKNVGILDMDPDDPRVAWYDQVQPTKIQKRLQQSGQGNYMSPDARNNFHPDDKFYEMHVDGRAVFFRVGPAWINGEWRPVDWAPDKRPSKKGQWERGHIKEIYDENGKALDPYAVFYHLNQDRIGDRVDFKAGELVGRSSAHNISEVVSFNNPSITQENKNKLVSTDFFAMLRGISGEKGELTYRPVEIAEDDYRQRSGTFTYDRISEPGADLVASGSAWRAKLPDLKPGTKAYRDHWREYLKFQPNVAFETLRATQWHVDQGLAKSVGAFIGRRYITEGGVPKLAVKRFTNTNPDGSTTIFEATPEADGRFYLSNPIWRALLTPNGSDIKSAEHLEQLCAQATEAANGTPPKPRRAWVSVRAEAKGRAGDREHFLHMQVEFDGRGQPKIRGEEFKHLTGREEPRIDDLLTPARRAEPETRRARVIAEKIKNEPQRRERKGRAKLPRPGERAIMRVDPVQHLGLKTAGPDREVIMRLTRFIPGKKAGEAPSPPGWDRMPEGFDDPYPGERFDEPVDALTEEESKLVASGQLPESYAGRPSERAWLEKMLKPALTKFKRSLKSLTKKEIAPRWYFTGEAGGGAGGKTIIFTGAQDVIDRIEYPPEEPRPERLRSTPLLYVHKTVDPRTGMLLQSDLRMLLPRDGHIAADAVDLLRGVEVQRDRETEAITDIVVDLDAIPRLRQQLGGMSLTGEAEELLRTHADEMRDLAEKAADSEHVIPLEDLDPAVLAQNGVGVNAKIFGGIPFRLGQHQAELVQKLIDNNGRVLGAHFMGTGKTISALVAAKTMMSRRDPNSPWHQGDAPKKTLIVAPLAVVEQWRQAAEDFDEGATVVGAKSSDIPVQKYLEMVRNGTDQSDMVVVGPEYFTQHADELKEAGFDAIVVDEAHQGIKNANTRRNKAIANWNPDMKMVMLLTGTPITTSPSDILEYIKILSNGQQWAGMSRAKLEAEYLEESPVPGEAGVRGRKGPKVQIKASKRDELAAILAKWTHVAMGKDVRGKILPAVRVEESKHAHMIGIQAALYAEQLAALPEAAREKLAENSALGGDETAGLTSPEQRRRVQAAKAIANCPAYKPASDEQAVMMTATTIDAEGKTGERRVPFRPFGKQWLKERKDIGSAKIRKQMKGRWPPVDELTPEQVLLFNRHYSHVIDPDGKGVTYEQVAGKKIEKAQWAAMDKRVRRDGFTYEPWADSPARFPRDVEIANPEAGPLGIKFRGISKLRQLSDDERDRAEYAQAFRRTYAALLTSPATEGKRTPNTQAEAWEKAKAEFGISEEEAQALLGVPNEAYTHQSSLTYGGVTVTTDDEYVSDTRGSLHLLYRKEDWDFEAGKPRSAGGFEKVRDLDRVEVSGKYSWNKKPRRADDDWEPPIVRYRADQGEISGQRVAVEIMSGENVGSIQWVRKSEMAAMVPSLMDPGRRDERAKADLAMVMGNAKAEDLMAYLEQFHVHTGNGDFAPGGERGRSAVLFANGILDGCRTMEATLRVAGYRDVNEVLSGSPHHDAADDAPSPNGKYFVTYIGSTYTGDRELNIEISKKLKDKLNRDTGTSLFVHKTQTGRPWKLWPGQPKHGQIQLSSWTEEQRTRIYNQFKIKAPEAHFTTDDGDVRYFYGTTDKIEIPGEFTTTKSGKRKPLTVDGSAGLLREMVLTGNPAKMTEGSPEQKAAEERLQTLQTLYEGLVREGTSNAAAKADPRVVDGPMTKRQVNVMNNCEILILSDAGQVGINKGDAVEMVMYDSLASPMAEMQRMTRSARMMPPAVKDAMLNKYITEIKGLTGGKFSYPLLQGTDPDRPGYVAGVTRIDRLWQEMQRTGKRPKGMTWTEYKDRADKNGTPAGTRESFERRKEFNPDDFRDANRVLFEKDGKIAVEYTPRGSKKSKVVFVDPSAIKEADGPFRRIREKMEAGAFDPRPVGTAPEGTVANARVFGGAPSTRTFKEVLTEIAAVADEGAEEAKTKIQAEEWRTISARARSAMTLGPLQAASALKEFETMRVPGATGNILGNSGLLTPDPTEQTYAIRTAAERAAGVPMSKMEQSIQEPVNAIRNLLANELSEQERAMIEKAGYVNQGESGGIDAAEIYLSMRAEQVLNMIDDLRPQVAARMRAGAGGKIVTDGDVMNTIIDELDPVDRAILKSKKYLVNVRRLGVSAEVPTSIKTRVQKRDPETGVPLLDEKGKPQMESKRVFTGYEPQYPVETERNTRAIGRSRLIPTENLLHTIQQGVVVRSDHDFHEAGPSQIASMSRKDPIAKSQIGLPLDLFKAKPPAGYQRIPGGKKGGYRKRVGGKWQYWYPDASHVGATAGESGPEAMTTDDAVEMVEDAMDRGYAWAELATFKRVNKLSWEGAIEQLFEDGAQYLRTYGFRVPSEAAAKPKPKPSADVRPAWAREAAAPKPKPAATGRPDRNTIQMRVHREIKMPKAWMRPTVKVDHAAKTIDLVHGDIPRMLRHPSEYGGEDAIDDRYNGLMSAYEAWEDSLDTLVGQLERDHPGYTVDTRSRGR
jgi:hypothetical protein